MIIGRDMPETRGQSIFSANLNTGRLKKEKAIIISLM